MKPPDNLEEMVQYIENQEYLGIECNRKNIELNAISKYIRTIGKMYLGQ